MKQAGISLTGRLPQRVEAVPTQTLPRKRRL
jgi:hypothetical protein